VKVRIQSPVILCDDGSDGGTVVPKAGALRLLSEAFAAGVHGKLFVWGCGVTLLCVSHSLVDTMAAAFRIKTLIGM
jgi:hypothetical protein